MFKSCCARPSKKISKSKSKTEKMNLDMTESNDMQTEDKLEDLQVQPEFDDKNESKNKKNEDIECTVNSDQNEHNETTNDEDCEASANHGDDGEVDTLDQEIVKRDFTKKRFSVDYKRNRLDFKRFSVDCRQDSATLEELARLEQELARTNITVRPFLRRKSSGILKSSTSNSNGIAGEQLVNKLNSCSDDDEVFEEATVKPETEGPAEPPATPVGRDELALRRHRFFSELVCAARAAVEHRVRFDPLGPVLADSGTEAEPTAANQNPSDLESLIERLERVTSRLEQLVVRARSPTPPRSPAPSPVSLPTSPAPQTLTEQLPSIDNMSVNGYQDLLQGPLRTYLELSQQIGGDVATHANLVNAAFQAQLRYIQQAAARSKPSQSEEMQLLAPTSEQISAIQQFREKNRASPFFNHLSAISESIPALGWVAVSATPAPYVKEMNDAGQFYTNRVLKEWKEKDKKHVEWCRTWVQLLSELQAYVKQYHTTGLVWSGKGAGAPPPPPGGMPPPPPVLPEADFSNLAIDDRSALFAQINQGEAITGSLRKVTSDMQTHKNPQLRQGPAPFKPAVASRAAAKPLPQPGAGTLPDKPPVFMRDGKKWLIEYQKGNPNLVVENADMNNVVYMFRCRDSALTVRGKINGVVLDSCTKCAVVFDNLVASVEFVNCQSVQMQVLGKVPTISIDKTDGCQIYLSPESLDVEIVSSKSSEMNVLVPKGNGDYAEHPIPEQFKTLLNKPRNGLTTTPVENKG
ncbi:adenylyl cyclase-associated protein 1 [Aphomia sociella]